jgi:hypothetical protein
MTSEMKLLARTMLWLWLLAACWSVSLAFVIHIQSPSYCDARRSHADALNPSLEQIPLPEHTANNLAFLRKQIREGLDPQTTDKAALRLPYFFFRDELHLNEVALERLLRSTPNIFYLSGREGYNRRSPCLSRVNSGQKLAAHV